MAWTNAKTHPGDQQSGTSIHPACHPFSLSPIRKVGVSEFFSDFGFHEWMSQIHRVGVENRMRDGGLGWIRCGTHRPTHSVHPGLLKGSQGNPG